MKETLEIIFCRANGAKIETVKPWELGEPVQFMYMPSKISTITAGFRDKAITVTLFVDEQAAETVQASFENLKHNTPKQKPFGCVEHREEEASVHPVEFCWGSYDGDEGILVTAEPTKLGVENVNGKIHRSWSPSFATDADYAKATLKGGVYTFPEGVRGSTSNPARITGIDFCVGTLTNKPAFRNMPPVKAKLVEGYLDGEVITAAWSPQARTAAALSRKAKSASSSAKTKLDHFRAAAAHDKAFNAHSNLEESSQEEIDKHAEEVDKHLKKSGVPEDEIGKFYDNSSAGEKSTISKLKKFVKATQSEIEADSIRATIEEPSENSLPPIPARAVLSREPDDSQAMTRKAIFKSDVAKLAEESFPEGEKHGLKQTAHREAAYAHQDAGNCCESAKMKEFHSESSEYHNRNAAEHAKVTASEDEVEDNFIQANWSPQARAAAALARKARAHGNDAYKEARENEVDEDSAKANGASEAANHMTKKARSNMEHHMAAHMHEKAAALHDKAGNGDAQEEHENMAEAHRQAAEETSDGSKTKVSAKNESKEDSIRAADVIFTRLQEPTPIDAIFSKLYKTRNPEKKENETTGDILARLSAAGRP